jgi:thiol peroxidase
MSQILLLVVCIIAFGLFLGCEKSDAPSSNKSKHPKSESQGLTPPERANAITLKGNLLTLLGKALNVGDRAPDAVLVGNDLSEKKLSEYEGSIRLLASVPSLDTPVCSTETRRFNEETANLGAEVAVLTISMDLPFAQKRWCGAEGIERVVTLSDYRHREFGRNYGVLIKELGLLARAVFVVDAEGIIRYVEIVRETTTEPNYEAALAVVKKLVSKSD